VRGGNHFFLVYRVYLIFPSYTVTCLFKGMILFYALNSFDIFWLLLSQPMHQVISGSVQVWLCHPLVNVAGIKVHG